MKKQITNVPINTLHGGGFYSLKNIQATEKTFLDIDILIEGCVNEPTDRDLLREAASKHAKRQTSNDMGRRNFSNQRRRSLMSDIIRDRSSQRIFSPPLTRADKILRQI